MTNVVRTCLGDHSILGENVHQVKGQLISTLVAMFEKTVCISGNQSPKCQLPPNMSALLEDNMEPFAHPSILA